MRCLTGHRVSKALPLSAKVIALTRAETVSKDEKAPAIADDCDRALFFLEQAHRREKVEPKNSSRESIIKELTNKVIAIAFIPAASDQYN